MKNYLRLKVFFFTLSLYITLREVMGSWHRLLNFLKYGAYLSNYCNLQLKSLLHLGQNVITFRTLLHFGLFITFRPSTYVIYIFSICEQSCHEGGPCRMVRLVQVMKLVKCHISLETLIEFVSK